MELGQPSSDVPDCDAPDWVQAEWKKTYESSPEGIRVLYPTLKDWLEKCKIKWINLSTIEQAMSEGTCLKNL
jgi:hypothetical protein